MKEMELNWIMSELGCGGNEENTWSLGLLDGLGTKHRIQTRVFIL